MTSSLALTFGATLGYVVQSSVSPDAHYLFLKAVSRAQILASAWVRSAIVGLVFWMDYALALRASAGAVNRDQAEVLLLALATSLLAASVTKPGSLSARPGGGRSLPGWMLMFWLFTNVIPICVSYVLASQRNQGRDFYPLTCLLVVAATPCCALVTFRAWKRSDVSASSILPVAQ